MSVLMMRDEGMRNGDISGTGVGKGVFSHIDCGTELDGFASSETVGDVCDYEHSEEALCIQANVSEVS